MGTQCAVSVYATASDTFLQIIVHSGGMVDDIGELLVRDYNAKRDAMKVVAHGDLRWLGPIKPTSAYDNPTSPISEQGKPRVISTLMGRHLEKLCPLTHSYIYSRGAWYVWDTDSLIPKWALLADVLAHLKRK